MSNPIRITEPAIEIISLDEAKTHLRIDGDDEDTAVSMLIVMAREFAEDYTRLAFISQTWRWRLDAWPTATPPHVVVPFLRNSPQKRYVRLPRGPLLSVEGVLTYDNKDEPTLWSENEYFVATGEDRLYRRTFGSWPEPGTECRGIEINYTAGFGTLAEDVPTPIRHATLMMVAYYYENREVVDGVGTKLVAPLGVRALLDPYKARRL